MSNIGKKIVVSASMMILATQAMAHVGSAGSQIIDIPQSQASDGLRQQLQAALSKRDVRISLGKVAGIVLESYGQGGESIVQRVAQAGGRAEGGKTDATIPDLDFTYGGQAGNPNVTCHSACHTACHGARGWR